MTIRPYAPSDLNALTYLINQADAVDRAGFATTEMKLAHSMSGPVAQRTFVATESDSVVGYVQLALDQAPGVRNYYGYGTVLPPRRRLGIGSALFRVALDYLQAVASTTTDQIHFNQFARLWIPGVEPLVQTHGFTRKKTLLSMRRPHLDALNTPALPPGYSLRPVTAADAAPCAAVYNDAYGWRGAGAVRTAEDMMGEITAPDFRADLFPVVTTPTGQVMGYCYSVLTAEQEGQDGSGRIYTIVVSRSEQGRGLGRTLLWHCLAGLKAAGARDVTLSVEEDNPTPAAAMYERAGFERWRTSMLYHKRVN